MICQCRKWARCLECILREGLTLARGCTCDPRFREVAHDIDCPVHGLTAEVREWAA